jgi:hypothetical protein
MTWNDRVVRTANGDEEWFAIYEIYYDDDGRPEARTEAPTNLANISFTLVRNEADCIRWSPSCCPVGSSRELLRGENGRKDVYNALLPRGLSLNHNFLSAVRLSCDPPV